MVFVCLKSIPKVLKEDQECLTLEVTWDNMYMVKDENDFNVITTSDESCVYDCDLETNHPSFRSEPGDPLQKIAQGGAVNKEHHLHFLKV